jgi:nicotinate (nicotinamide) nucleotide adenylyltransferase
MTEVQLLDKTEVWIRGARVSGADLPSIARVAASVLSLPADRVFVTDIGSDHICFDILIPQLRLDSFAGKQRDLLDALRAIPGVTLTSDAAVHSEGILGLIGAAPDVLPEILSEAARMEEGLRSYISRRVAVISTGAELMDGRVRDTNLEASRDILGAAGYEVESGGAVPDDRNVIAGRIARLANEDYSLIITTGGVGAEAKDQTVEALEQLDPKLATAALATFEAGHGRHVKSAIRIAMGRVGHACVVALPGPTHEVRLALPVLLDGLKAGTPAPELIERIAIPLRATLPSRHGHVHRQEPAQDHRHDRRIGVFGGTFDPVHNGHLHLAHHALRALSLDKVIFVPSGVPPSPNKTGAITDVAKRIEMLEAAVQGEPKFSVSNFEATSPGISHTVKTLRHMADRHPPPAQLFFLMGADIAAKVDRWVGIDEMRKLAHFVAVSRAGQVSATAPSWVTVLDIPVLELSSSALRAKTAGGRSVEGETPPAVADLIVRNGLYRNV